MMSSIAAPLSNLAPSQARSGLAASRFSLWCDRLIEVGWLSALIVAPLLFNIYSSRVFEPDKITTVRSIALIMVAIWLVKWVEERRNRSPEAPRITWRTPLVLPTMIMIIVYMISTALSVAPRTSLLGSYQRLQGTYTTFSYIVIFMLMVQTMRTRTQFNRAINLWIINSLPIAIYGMIQRAGLDPLPWGGDVVERVAGNMGNAIFIAAYLIMTFFLTLGKIAEVFVTVLKSEESSVADVVRAAAYIIIAIINAFVVLVLAGSRGPQLGWLTGIFFMAVLLMQLIRNRKTRLIATSSTIGVSALGLALLIALNVSTSSALDGLRQLPVLNRLSTAFDTQGGTNRVRVLIWEGNVNLMSPHEPIQFPDGSADAYNAIRPLVGYGPEGMYVSYNRFYPPALANLEARNASPDRSHNETWDSIVITGIFGFLAYMFLFGSFFYYGFKWIGLITSSLEKRLFPFMWTVGAIIGGIAAASSSPSLVGVGIGGGAVAGLSLFVVISALINSYGKTEGMLHSQLSLADQVIVISIIAAAVAHYIEIHLGIAIVSTRTHFWGFAALMVLLGMGYIQGTRTAEVSSVEPEANETVQPHEPEVANATSNRRRRAQQARNESNKPIATRASGAALPNWFYSVVVFGLFMGLILGIMAFDFMNNPERVTVPGTVFLNALTVVKGQARYGVLFMFLLTWIIGTVILIADAYRDGSIKLTGTNTTHQLWAAVALCMSVSLMVWVAFGTFIAGRLVAFITTRQSSVDDILNIAEQLSFFPAYVYLIVFVIMGLAASLLVSGEEWVKPRVSISASGLAAAMGAVLVFLPISTSNLQTIRADIIYKQASPWDGQGAGFVGGTQNIQGWDLGIEHHRRAIQLAQNEDFYYLFLGRALLEKAKTTPSKSEKSWADDTNILKVTDDGPTYWNRSRVNQLPSVQLGREDLLTAAKAVLIEARRINPLNTDHSANLARMWRQSGDITQDATLKTQRYQNSLKEYATATSLSPQNAQLFNEWATLLAYSVGDQNGGIDKLKQSLVIDSKYDQTYLLLGDMYFQQAQRIEQDRQKAAAANPPDTAKTDELKRQFDEKLKESKKIFSQALVVNPNATQVLNVLASIDQQLGNLTDAISATQASIDKNPRDWVGYRNLALLMQQAGQIEPAKQAAQKALELAPKDQQPVLQQFVQQLGGK